MQAQQATQALDADNLRGFFNGVSGLNEDVLHAGITDLVARLLKADF